jgi:hypothetical protein
MRDVVTLSELKALDWTAADVARSCPGAVERVALDGAACWDRSDLAPLLGDEEDGEYPQ